MTSYWTRRKERLERQVKDPGGFNLERIKVDLEEALREWDKEQPKRQPPQDRSDSVPAD